MIEKLWDEQRIAAYVFDYALGFQARHILTAMRDEYESVLTFDRRRYAEQKARIDELEAECARWLARIDELDTWLGEAWTENTDLEQQLREIKQLYAARLVPDEEEMQDA